MPEIFFQYEYNRLRNLGIALVISINSQLLLLDNYTDVIFLSITATDEYYDFFAASLSFFCLYWLIRICMTALLVENKKDADEDSLLSIALMLLEIEPGVFPLLPKWLYECLTCSKSSDNDEKEQIQDANLDFDKKF